jgi:anti-sigma B factor antagonist
MPIESKRSEAGAAVIALSGRLVFGRDLEQLETAVKKLIEQGEKRTILDATALDYVDSAAIGALVSCVSHVKKAGGELRLAGASPRIVRLFSMTGVDKLLPVYPSIAEAAAGQ